MNEIPKGTIPEATEAAIMQISEERLVLVDFYADWCKPCTAMLPILREIAVLLDDRIKVVKVNVEREYMASFVTRVGVRGVPTLALIRKGQIIETRNGSMTAAAIRSWIDNAIGT